MVDTVLLGRAKELEVAGALVRNGLYVYYPLVDTGADLVVANKSASVLLPVQVKFRSKDPALSIPGSSLRHQMAPNLVLAFVIGQPPDSRTWYIPFSAWQAMARGPQADGACYVPIRKNERVLAKYEADGGIRRCFAKAMK